MKIVGKEMENFSGSMKTMEKNPGDILNLKNPTPKI